MDFGANWSYGLIKAMEDASKIIFKSEELVCIRDLYPKSRQHFLILPKEDIDNVFDLSSEHIELVEEIQLMGINAIELAGHDESQFRMGFHIQPSMKRLHLHVISKDFDSPCLKHKKHWNSFNTDFLLHPSKLIEQLQQHGSVQKQSEEFIKNLLNTPLQCNSCSYKPKHMPDLKKHLLTHVSLYEAKKKFDK